MKKIFIISILFLISITTHLKAIEEILEFGRFGKVTIYMNSPEPSHVILFVSGDGGWNLGVIDMARTLASLDALVVGIDIIHYLRQMESAIEKCSYPAADFEALSKYVQQKYKFSSYILPVLIGYSSGATLIYATIVQSPPNTFLGGISLGFCPDLPLKKEMCSGYGLKWTAGPKGKGFSFLPAPELPTPWIAFQGTVDLVCRPKNVDNYVKQIKQAELILLPKVGHGFAVQKNWMPQFKDAFIKLSSKPKTTQHPQAEAVKDLPLVEVTASGTALSTFAVIISGDGGWASIDKDIAGFLSKEGIPTAGLNSLQYFWKRRDPGGAAKDLERIIRYYLQAWNKEKVMLIGYSLGADVLPFMANRLPKDLLDRVELIVFLGVEHTVDFQFHILDWFASNKETTSLPVFPEVQKLQGKPMLCFYGSDEKDTLCKELPATLAKVVPLQGGHHFGHNYDPIIKEILNARSSGTTK